MFFVVYQQYLFTMKQLLILIIPESQQANTCHDHKNNYYFQKYAKQKEFETLLFATTQHYYVYELLAISLLCKLFNRQVWPSVFITVKHQFIVHISVVHFETIMYYFKGYYVLLQRLLCTTSKAIMYYIKLNHWHNNEYICILSNTSTFNHFMNRLFIITAHYDNTQDTSIMQSSDSLKIYIDICIHYNQSFLSSLTYIIVQSVINHEYCIAS